MGETKTKKFNLGKLFGLSSSNLSHLDDHQKNHHSNTSHQQHKHENIPQEHQHLSIKSDPELSNITPRSISSKEYLLSQVVHEDKEYTPRSRHDKFINHLQPNPHDELAIRSEDCLPRLRTASNSPSESSLDTASPMSISSGEQNQKQTSSVPITTSTSTSYSLSGGERERERERERPREREKPQAITSDVPYVSRQAIRSPSRKRSISPGGHRYTSLSRSGSTKLKSESPAPPALKPRFHMLDNGSHEHNLRSAKRQEKLSNMLKDFLGAKKRRDEAVSAVPDILGSNQQTPSKPPTLFASLVLQAKNDPNFTKPTQSSAGPDCRSFVEKYGRCQEVIGRGAFGVVRVSHKKNDATSLECLYAVKEFKKRVNESEKKYNRRLTSEFCISSSLKHINIINTLDLLKDAKGDYCAVMEFCSGGDLYTLIIGQGKLEYAEADCYFKQLIRGVNYMHEMGVAHRDLKPENLLLTQNGVLKITDFGNSELFKVAWEKDIHYSEGICGSSPYIAPEEFTQETFDARCVDVWSCGVIYMAMRTGRQLWKLAVPEKDEFFEEYLTKRKEEGGYEPIENLKRERCRNVIYSILDPIPGRRITTKQILNSEWGREIKVCDAGEGKCKYNGQLEGQDVLIGGL